MLWCVRGGVRLLSPFAQVSPSLLLLPPFYSPQFRSYQKKLAVLPGSSAGGGSGAALTGPAHVVKAPVGPGDDLLAAVGLDFGKAGGYVDPVRAVFRRASAHGHPAAHSCRFLCDLSLQVGADRMAAQLSSDKERRKDFHRRRLVNEEEGVDYINEKNRRLDALGWCAASLYLRRGCDRSPSVECAGSTGRSRRSTTSTLWASSSRSSVARRSKGHVLTMPGRY